MLDQLKNIAIAEFLENDLQVDVVCTITGLNNAADLLADLGKVGDEGQTSMAIDGLSAIVSAMTYLALMHETVKSVRNMKGGAQC